MKSKLMVCAAALAASFALAQAAVQTSPGQTTVQSSGAAQITQGPTIRYADDQFAVITWQTSGPSDSRVFYGTDSTNLTQAAEGATNVTSHRVDLPNLQANTTYYFQIDNGQSGAQAGSAPTYSLLTPGAGGNPLHNLEPVQVQMNAPAANNPTGMIGGSTSVASLTDLKLQFVDDGSAVITWQTEQPSGSTVFYGTDKRNLNHNAYSTGQATSHKVHLTDLVPATTYYFAVDVGHGPSAGAAYSFRTTARSEAPLYDVQPQMVAAQSSTPQNMGSQQNVQSPQPSGRTGDLQARPQQGPLRGSDVAAGTEIDATLQTALSTRTSQVGQQFTATVSQPVRGANGEVAIPAGSKLTGEVTEAEQGKTLPSVRGRGKLNLHFTQVQLPDGTTVSITATLVSVHDTKANEEGQVQSSTSGKTAAKDVGIGAGLGTLGGLIFGSALKGLVIGAVAGGGYVLATKGKDVELPENTGMKLRLDENLRVPVRQYRQ